MAAPSTVSLKLLINTQTQKVLFAEAGKDFVDFLFSILSVPVAEIVGLVGQHGMVGSVANLYESIENLNETYLQSNHTKTTLLKPPVSPLPTLVPLLAINDAPAKKKLYTCSYDFSSCYYSYSAVRYRHPCSIYVSDDSLATCPQCNRHMTFEMSYVPPPAQLKVSAGDGGGFVKGVVTYMVMDDLVVKPMSTISSITVLNKFHVSNVGALEEEVVDFGMKEAAKLLKASLETKNVLTSVFMI